MRKILSVLLCLSLSLGILSGCGTAATEAAAPARQGASASDDELRIVTTIFPLYDWTRVILGDRMDEVSLTMLLDNGVDLHSYQPTTEDMVTIATADLFLYVGGESDSWVKDALRETTASDVVAIDLMEVLGDQAKTEEIVEGMEHDHDHDHDDEHDDHDDHDHDDDHDDHDHADEDHEHGADEVHDEAHHHDNDEHFWLSLRCAQTLCTAIADQICAIDPDHASRYATNTAAYLAQLAALDEAYTETVAQASSNTLLFADRFPFRYLADDYGLTYYAAFPGCSAETEASFETIAFLAGKVDELGLHSILTIEGSDHKIAETVSAATATKDQTILTLDSLQSVTADDIQNGVTYLSVMEDDLAVLHEALN